MRREGKRKKTGEKRKEERRAEGLDTKEGA